MLLRTVSEKRNVSSKTRPTARRTSFSRRLAHVLPSMQDPPAGNVVEPGDQAGDGALPRRGRADQGDGLSAANVQVKAVEDRSDPPVAERHVVEVHRARSGRQRRRARVVLDRGLGGEDGVDAAGRRRRARQLAEQHADHAQRPDEHEHVEVRLDDVADREVAFDHLVPAVPEDADETERRQEVDQRQEVRRAARA